MTRLEALLRRIPAVHADLLEASTPGRRAEPSDRAPDPRDKPAPGNLGVMEHRALLVRGLRWWVDAVRERGEHTQVGHDPARMCLWLADHLDVMASEDREELHRNLSSWLGRAWSMLDRAPREPDEPKWARIPPDAWEQTVPVATAADVLGCTVRTIQRRVRPEDRPAGRLVLRLALGRCGECDQPRGLCDHTRCESCGLILGQCAHSAQNVTPGVA